MAYTDVFTNFHLLMRWLHVIAGVVWIGHLYFFNFVNVPLQGALDDASKKAVNPQLMPRALWWFRWGAMITFLAGLVLFVMNYMYAPGVGFGSTDVFIEPEPSGLTRFTGRAVWILFGMTLGTIMWFNVWFIIWPAQKRMLSGQVPPDQIPAVRKKAGLASRINTFLSGPMLFGMLAPAHYGSITVLTLIVAAAVGALAIWGAIQSSFQVGKTV